MPCVAGKSRGSQRTSCGMRLTAGAGCASSLCQVYQDESRPVTTGQGTQLSRGPTAWEFQVPTLNTAWLRGSSSVGGPHGAPGEAPRAPTYPGGSESQLWPQSRVGDGSSKVSPGAHVTLSRSPGASWQGARQPELRPSSHGSSGSLVILIMKGQLLWTPQAPTCCWQSLRCHRRQMREPWLPWQGGRVADCPCPQGAVWDIFKDALLSLIKYASAPVKL